MIQAERSGADPAVKHCLLHCVLHMVVSATLLAGSLYSHSTQSDPEYCVTEIASGRIQESQPDFPPSLKKQTNTETLHREMIS